jgi:hypothetical protein
LQNFNQQPSSELKILIEVMLMVDGMPASQSHRLKSTSSNQFFPNSKLELNGSCCYYTIADYDSMCVDIDKLHMEYQDKTSRNFQLQFKAIAFDAISTAVSYITHPVLSDTIDFKPVSLQILRFAFLA